MKRILMERITEQLREILYKQLHRESIKSPLSFLLPPQPSVHFSLLTYSRTLIFKPFLSFLQRPFFSWRSIYKLSILNTYFYSSSTYRNFRLLFIYFSFLFCSLCN